jgi:hypothetical protein
MDRFQIGLWTASAASLILVAGTVVTRYGSDPEAAETTYSILCCEFEQMDCQYGGLQLHMNQAIKGRDRVYFTAASDDGQGLGRTRWVDGCTIADATNWHCTGRLGFDHLGSGVITSSLCSGFFQYLLLEPHYVEIQMIEGEFSDVRVESGGRQYTQKWVRSR